MSTRKVKSSNDFFDLLDKLRNNCFVSIGYVTGANLDVPKVKRINPKSGRPKGYPDYTPFKNEGYPQEIGALVKITAYNFRYSSRDAIAHHYDNVYKPSANEIRGEVGLPPIKDAENSYKETLNYGVRGVDAYSGNNSDLEGNTYNPQNVFGAKIKGVTYVVGTDGHIIRGLSDNEVKPYLKAKREIDGVSALRKMGVDEEKIQQYIEKIKALKFTYKNFESHSILWMCATVDGEKIVYINDSLRRAVDGIDINPSDFRAIARERYQISLNDLHEMVQRYNSNIINESKHKNKKIVRLTESELKQMIAESIMATLMEGYGYDRQKGSMDGLAKSIMDVDDPWGDGRGAYDKHTDDAIKHGKGYALDTVGRKRAVSSQDPLAMRQ